jgi:hypothetical protein
MDGYSNRTPLAYISFIIVIIALSLFTCSRTTRFTLLPLYCKSNFSGSDLGSQNMVITPLLTGAGIERSEQLTPEKVIETVKQKRRDLPLRPPRAFEDRFINKFGPDELESAYGKLYKGSIVEFQNAPTFWNEVQSDYLMVVRLTYGLTIKAIDSRKMRQIRLEGELWDCDSMEVIWRTAVSGRCEDGQESDATFLMEAECRIFNALPAVRPGYGKNKW